MTTPPEPFAITDRNDQAELDAAFRAIGRYVHEFSCLCADFKQAIASLSGLTGTAHATIELVTGEMTAAPLANACFAVFEQFASDAEIEILRALRNKVLEEINRRNDLMHGDWWIGWWGTTGVEGTDGKIEQVSRKLPPTLERVKPGRSGPEKRSKEEMPIARLEEIADEVTALRHTFEEIEVLLRSGLIAIPPDERQEPDRASLLDVWVVEKKSLKRTGPLAGRVRHWRKF